MFLNIKSSYIMKKIFAYQSEELKLKICKYNKSLQNILNINLINYKTLSGRYILYETKEKGKEYYSFNNKLIFEGEYLNGKRNGKGKEYYDDSIVIFEGEYLKGKRNGKGKIYYIDCFGNENIKFEGEYLNGEKNGKGKEYYENGNLKFEGEYLNGNPINGIRYDPENNAYNYNGNGFIKDYDYNGLLFEGEYLNGLKNGKGKVYNYNGELEYEGEYLNDKLWNGKNNSKNNNYILELKEGKGFMKRYGEDNDNLICAIEIKNGEENGKASYYNEINGNLIFEGEYLNGYKNGKGREYDFDGELIFEGEYLYDHKIKGKSYINGKLEYEGEYACDKKWNGKGYDKNGNIIYELNNGTGKVKEYDKVGYLLFEGEYLNGWRNRKGKEYWNGILIFEGEYLNGLRNGKGKEYNHGNLKFEGEYLNGEKMEWERNMMVLMIMN